MTGTANAAELKSRSLVGVIGPDWRDFLQGLLSQDVETLRPGELRFGALLTPQGKLLFDLFILGRDDGCWLDVAADRRDALIQRLTIYKLRAKVEIAAVEAPVWALWGGEAPGWPADPRLPALGWRGYGAEAPRVVWIGRPSGAYQVVCVGKSLSALATLAEAMLPLTSMLTFSSGWPWPANTQRTRATPSGTIAVNLASWPSCWLHQGPRIWRMTLAEYPGAGPGPPCAPAK